MATLQSDDRNIIEADEINWRIIVYPILAVLVALVGGFGIYYYHLNQLNAAETQARESLVQAKSPAELVKVADQFPHTIQASLALISAADASYAKKDFDGAIAAYQRVASEAEARPELRDSAQFGLGSTQEAAGKMDDAIKSYLEVAHKGSKSAFAPAAYSAVSQIYASRKDKANEEKILQEMIRLDNESPFVKEAAARLKELNGTPAVEAAAPTANQTAPATNAAPAKPQS